MLIVGAKGFAKEVLEIIHTDFGIDHTDIFFFDNVSDDLPELLFNKFRIYTTFDQVKNHFQTHSNDFALGLGSPVLRAKLQEEFIKLGGNPVTVISKLASIGSFGTQIGAGSSIMQGALVSNNCSLGKANLIYFNSVVSHDAILGDYVELSPGAIILGRCKIGNYTSIGSNATILPDITLGNNVIIGAGAVVTKDIPDNSKAVGVPARII